MVQEQITLNSQIFKVAATSIVKDRLSYSAQLWQLMELSPYGNVLFAFVCAENSLRLI